MPPLSLDSFRTRFAGSPFSPFVAPRGGGVVTGLPSVDMPLGDTTQTQQLTAAQATKLAADNIDCDALPAEFLRVACRLGKTLLGDTTGEGTKPDKNGGLFSGIIAQVPDECGPGKFRVGETCVSLGDAAPGGLPLTTQAGGVLVRGGFGIPAETPSIVGFRSDKSGGLNPIRQCRRGMVLGIDDLCYTKTQLPRRNRNRKHRGEKKPPISVKQMNAMKMIGSLQDTVKELAGDVQLTCKRK